VYVNKLSSDSRCIYPEQADHIIDIQCRGAHNYIDKSYLHPKGTFYEEIKDLLFLYKTDKNSNSQK